MGSVHMSRVYGWQRFYEAAILAAQAAIDARLQQLQSDHNGTADARLAISDALSGLSVLRKEIN